jgi:hypothetical protein
MEKKDMDRRSFLEVSGLSLGVGAFAKLPRRASHRSMASAQRRGNRMD